MKISHPALLMRRVRRFSFPGVPMQCARSHLMPARHTEEHYERFIFGAPASAAAAVTRILELLYSVFERSST